MIISNATTSDSMEDKAVGVHQPQSSSQTLKSFKTTTAVSIILEKAMKRPLVKSTFSKKEIIQDNPFLTLEEITEECFQGSNPLMEDFLHDFKKIVFFIKALPIKLAI